MPHLDTAKKVVRATQRVKDEADASYVEVEESLQRARARSSGAGSSREDMAERYPELGSRAR